jgi:hypothetical protein
LERCSTSDWQVRCKERLSGLVRCLSAFSGKDGWAQEGLRALAAQIASPPALAAMLCRGLLGRDGDTSLVMMRQRAKALLPVLDVLIDAASGDLSSVIPWW